MNESIEKAKEKQNRPDGYYWAIDKKWNKLQPVLINDNIYVRSIGLEAYYWDDLKDFSWISDNPIQNPSIEKIFALEAEKPEDDALKCANELADKCIEDDSLGFIYNEKRSAQIIQSYAESYHVSECARCKSMSCETCRWESSYAEGGKNPCLTCKGGVEIFRRWEPITEAPK